MSFSSDSKESDDPKIFGFRKSRRKSVLRSSDRQWDRVRQVGIQSFLYVTSYILCFGPTTMRQVLDGRGLEKEDGAEKIFLPLLLVQCVLLPSQGTFFCIIFFRPKYLKNRQKKPNKTRIWAARSAIDNDKQRPITAAIQLSPKANKQHVLKAVDENKVVEDADVPAGSLSEISHSSSVDSVMPSVASRVEASSRTPPSQGRRSIISILSGANNNNNSSRNTETSSSDVTRSAHDIDLSNTSGVDESSSDSGGFGEGSKKPGRFIRIDSSGRIESSEEFTKNGSFLQVDGFDIPVNSSQYST